MSYSYKSTQWQALQLESKLATPHTPGWSTTGQQRQLTQDNSSLAAAFQNLGQTNYSFIVSLCSAACSHLCGMCWPSVQYYILLLKLWQMFQLWETQRGIEMLVLKYTFYFKLCKIVPDFLSYLFQSWSQTEQGFIKRRKNTSLSMQENFGRSNTFSKNTSIAELLKYKIKNVFHLVFCESLVSFLASTHYSKNLVHRIIWILRCLMSNCIQAFLVKLCNKNGVGKISSSNYSLIFWMH